MSSICITILKQINKLVHIILDLQVNRALIFAILDDTDFAQL